MIQDLTSSVLAKAIDASALRHRAISNNLANVETPGYSRQEVKFEDRLREALESPMMGFSPFGAGPVDGVEATMEKDTTSPVRDNGNNVDVDREMASLAENTLTYEALLQTVSLKGQILKAAIYEGKR